jgi:hypothetical protein
VIEVLLKMSEEEVAESEGSLLVVEQSNSWYGSVSLHYPLAKSTLFVEGI